MQSSAAETWPSPRRSKSHPRGTDCSSAPAHARLPARQLAALLFPNAPNEEYAFLQSWVNLIPQHSITKPMTILGRGIESRSRKPGGLLRPRFRMTADLLCSYPPSSNVVYELVARLERALRRSGRLEPQAVSSPRSPASSLLVRRSFTHGRSALGSLRFPQPAQRHRIQTIPKANASLTVIEHNATSKTISSRFCQLAEASEV